jgi:hypothetical protein
MLGLPLCAVLTEAQAQYIVVQHQRLQGRFQACGLQGLARRQEQ